MGAVQDKFGEHVHIVRTSLEKYAASVQLRLTRHFGDGSFSLERR